ncbi:tripartite motif-containing protein 3-like [Branchiostoma lanceolatum]|uniref:tripartite motif-containing protein 3-like n=1 Tax=Branchiostoma lanceolatum TaxID=7740 RepID=UPI00345230A4
MAALTVLTALIIATVFPAKHDSYTQTTWTDPSFTGQTTDDVTQHVDYTSSPQTSTEELKQTAIVFGGDGEEPGQLFGPGGVVVSPSNEIFVADTYNMRVQVFSMAGVYLRHFPTITSKNEFETMEPKDISIDGEGHLWLNGDYNSSSSGLVVRLTKTGQHLTTVYPVLQNNSFLGIAVDALREHVVVTELWYDYTAVKVLHFNGTAVRWFRVQQGSGYPELVAVGREGNLFVSDFWRGTPVFVYNSTGHYLFSFTDEEFGEWQTIEITGICVDSSGHVLLSTGPGGTVEMFTADGRYVRRAAAGMFRADGVAVGPAGQLVVTDDDNSTVTVFSHY